MCHVGNGRVDTWYIDVHLIRCKPIRLVEPYEVCVHIETKTNWVIVTTAQVIGIGVGRTCSRGKPRTTITSLIHSLHYYYDSKRIRQVLFMIEDRIWT